MPPSRSEALAGVRVTLLESRMSSEMGDLVRRHGGHPRSVPTVRETPMDAAAPVADFLTRLQTPASRAVIFLTGVGVTALFHEAEKQGQLGFLVETLSRTPLVCRGPKPAAALKRQGLAASILAATPYTSAEVLEALAGTNVDGVEVTLVHYGERNGALADALRGRQAQLYELCLYEWQLPDDTQPMKTLVYDVIAGEVDAIVFTSQIQGKHLLQIAAVMGLEAAFVSALNSKTTVAAVGPICRSVLEELGITPHVVPVNPKMGPLVAALAEYWAAKRR